MMHHNMESVATQCAKNSCDVFPPLMAMTLFLIFSHNFEQGLPADPDSTLAWHKYLLKAGLTPWCSLLFTSPIPDPYVPRHGVIIDFAVTGNFTWWKDSIDFYIQANLLVYVNWGHSYNTLCTNS